MKIKSWTHARARVAGLTSHRDESDPDLIEARRDVKAARLRDVVENVVSSAPPLSREQSQEIAALLTNPANHDG